MADKTISHSKVIDAPAHILFDIVADPAMHPVIDGSDTVRGPRGDNPDRLSLGAKFGMNMRMGRMPYPIRNVVKEFEDGKRIAWCHIAGNRWRYEFEEVDGGTKVTETFDWSQARNPEIYLRKAGFLDKAGPAIEATLERLAEVAAQRVSAQD